MIATSKLLSMNDAAERLGYSRSGLQKLVDNTKRRGKPPYIRFLQTGKGARIKFLPAWLDEFVEAYSNGRVDFESLNQSKRARPKRAPSFQLDLSRLHEWPS